jgi:hypothetical protein
VISEVEKSGARAVRWTFQGFGEPNPLLAAGCRHVLREDVRAKWALRVAQRLAVPADLARDLVVQTENEAASLFEISRPAAFAGWGLLEPPFGITADVAKEFGVSVWNMEAGILPGSLRVEPENAAHFLGDGFVTSRSDEVVGQALLRDLSAAHCSIHPQRIGRLDLLAMTLSRRPRVLVLGAVEAGSGMMPEGSAEKKQLLPGFSDTYAIAEHVAADRRFTVFFKPHPFGGGMLERRVHPRVRMLRSEPAALIAKADIVVTAAGKLEATTILLDKPLIRVGRSFLGGCPVGREIQDPAQLLPSLHEALSRFDPQSQRGSLASALGFLYRNGWICPPGAPGMSEADRQGAIRAWVSRLRATPLPTTTP